jgi:outer membrane protein OmpA-like peptidoglycan-associated protein
MKNLKIMIRQLFGLIILMIFSQFIVAQSPAKPFFEMNEFEIGQVGFNTQASEFGPSFVENDLWFSAYTDRQVRQIAQGKINKTFYSLFKTPIDSNGFTSSEQRVLIRDIKSGFHEGPVSYCKKTGELFLTLSNTVNIDVEVDGIIVKKQVIRLRLVVCKKNNEKWVIQQEMPFNDPVYSVGQPSISPSGDTLFFASDIPALSRGGTDIFMVIRNDNSWGTPIDLGNNINTTGNEMFPSYHPSGMLIFASNGRQKGKGGLDLYVSYLSNGEFSESKPLDFFNTRYDDFGLVIHQSGKVGYFVSNRPGPNGDDDIYPVIIRNTFMQLAGIVVDDRTGNPIAGANVDLYSCEKEKIEKDVADNDGHFSFKVSKGKCYLVGASQKNYTEEIKPVGENAQVEIRLKRERSLELLVLDYDKHTPVKDADIKINNIFTGKTSDDGTVLKELTSEKELDVAVSAKGYLNQSVKLKAPEIGKLQQTILMMKMEMNKTFVLDNIYYDLDSWKILPSSEIELNKLVTIMRENPTLKIELGSHTDSRGSDQYNLTLSQKRSESAVAYIIKSGIAKDRIIAKGYGETKLLNRCKNGVACTDDEHRVNRRTEFKIIGFVK